MVMLTETETDLVKALEKSAKDSIKESNLDIGLMLKCKEKFNTQEITDLVNYFITLAQYQIEEDHAEITKWRSWKKESCRVRG